MDYVKTKSPSLLIDDVQINGSAQTSLFIPNDANEINISIKGQIKEPMHFDVESFFFNNYDTPFAFYSPSHYGGITQKFEPGEFSLERTITLPNDINKGSMYMSLTLCDPGKTTFMELTSKIKVEFEGVPMKNGWVFMIDNAGMLYLK